MNTLKRSFAIFLSLTLSFYLLANTQSFAAENVSSEYLHTYFGDGYEVIFELLNQYSGGYNANITIRNTGNYSIENWHLTLSIPEKIDTIWNAKIRTETNGTYILQNAGWNQDIPAGSSVTFGFTAEGDFSDYPETYNLLGETSQISNEAYEVTYTISDIWENGFIGKVTIQNKQNMPMEDWRLCFRYDNEICEIWDAVISKKNDNFYEISGQNYNQNIAANSSLSFSFRVEGGDNTLSLSDSSFSQIMIGTDSSLDTNPDSDENIDITIFTDSFIQNEALDCYFISEPVYTLSGTVTHPELLIDFNYQISDINNTVIQEGYIEPQADWHIEDFGLVVGVNFITITAHTSTEEFSVSLVIINNNEDNMKQLSIDWTDNDGDGLINYYETVLGTDLQNPDTDSDNISDFDEIARIGTNPVLPDTDKNGILDGEEDFDLDGLTNLEELHFGTNPFIADTDDDGLKDGAEIHAHKTDPLISDTDKDGLRDGAEPELGFDPANPDTDGNGIIDSEETLSQIYIEEIFEEEKPEILSVSVALDCKGLIDDVVDIHNIYNLDMKTSDVVGLIGAPVDISVNTSFQEATITFEYDETALGDTKEENLCIMWYDEEHDTYVLLEDSAVDTELNTVSYVTDHFSTYLVVDKEIWFDTWRQDINYQSSDNVAYYDIALVVDVSGSMSGDRIDLAKTALHTFINAMMEEDRCCLVKFNSTATLVQELTSDKQLLSSGVNSLHAGGNTSANAGLQKGIFQLTYNSDSSNKMLVLICDGTVSYAPRTLENAINNDITIHCINVTDGSSKAMQTLASKTNGMYYYAATSNDIENALAELQKDTIDSIDMTDSDGDGLYDVYETTGMRLSNGQIVYTDPTKADSDGDGINDYDAMGGEPVQEEYRLNGNVYSCTLNHAVVYGKLSPDFIYVDGTINQDGKQYYGRMEYVPYSEAYRYQVYEKETNVKFDGYDIITVSGDAGVHGSFSHVLADKEWYDIWGYFLMAAITEVLIPANLPHAKYCFYAYMTGNGGTEQGLADGSTRLYLNSQFVVTEKLFGLNSGNTYLQDNMYSAAKAAEAVLNEYNTEVYLSLSPNTVWTGTSYHDTNTILDMEQNLDALFNLSAFGTYNKADAAVTLHCIYDPASETYYMEYVYYLIDFYDFSFYKVLYNLDKLGLAKSYELYGVCPGDVSWHKGDDSYSFVQVLAGGVHYETQKEN